jgi:DUF1680 family protein
MMGALPEFIYSIADDGVYVDLFASSTIKFPVEKGIMTLNMKTRFPYDPKVELKVTVSDMAASRIRIRIPSWAAHDMQIDVNGKKMASGKPGTYVTISRQWKNDDVISFTIPMNFRITKYTGEEKETGYDRYALEYGPVLMACVSLKDPKDKLVLHVMPEKLAKSLIPVPRKPLHFTLEGDTGLEYKPYFEVQEEFFSCYPMVAQKN